MSNFVHLHVHSDFSLLDASASVEGLAKKAQALGMSHLALTDHGNMFGLMDFLAACKDRVKPIIGCEVYVSPRSRFEKKGAESDNKYYHLILLASNREGYFNLTKLCTFAYTEGFYYRPRIDDELLVKYSKGLIALSACVSGEIPRLIRGGKLAEAEAKALHYRDLFGTDEKGNPNFYLEIQNHGIPAEVFRGTLSQMDINKVMIDIAAKTGIPLVATNDVHYLEQNDHVAHDVLLCIGTAKFRSDEKRKKYYGNNFYLKSAEEMAALFPDQSEALANTVRIAERCVADIPHITTKELPNYLPASDLPLGFDNASDYLRHLASEGLSERYAAEKALGGERWQEIQKRLNYELDTIIQMGFTGYFLIVGDFIGWARKQGIPVGPGRGSGAGSVAAYSLRITDIDPFRYGLLFERFLNPERISMPDFDIDFANYGRDDVIRYVTEKYGKERVGQIITFGTLGAKAVITDVARTLEISVDEAKKITKLIPFGAKVTLEQALKEEPRLREMEADPRYTEMFALARKLEGLNRQVGIHASGVVIGRSAINELVPLYKDSKTDAIATQYSMGFLENCGLVKMDFLGLKTLDVIKHTEDLIHNRGGQYAAFNVEDAAEDDPATFKMLGEGDSFEIFQFASDGMRDVLRKAKPTKVEDLIALNALYRPGPMDNIPQFIASKNGTRAITYPDPSLETILKETYGVIVYQEQVMQVAQIIAGYTMGEADLLRRAMGKKIRAILDKEKVPFLEGAIKLGVPKAKADEIYELLVPFAGYGFNKSHAAGYAVLAYRTAYLKANFPAEFMAANLSNEINSANKDKLSECIDEARKMGIQIDPPDVNHSEKLFSITEGRIVYGLLGIKGIGEASADEIVRGRQEGAYESFMDFLDKVDIKIVGKAVIEKLIDTGAFDVFGERRENLSGNLERAVEFAVKQKDDRQFGQASLFGDTNEKEYVDFIFEQYPEISKTEKLKQEKQLIGFYLSGHPLDEHREMWQKAVKVNLGCTETLQCGSSFLMGIVKECKVVPLKTGGKMAYATIADYNGEIEAIFFSKIWEQCQDKFEKDDIAIFKGKIDYQADKDKYSFVVDSYLAMQDLENALREEQAQARKWDKYRNVWKYAKELELTMPNLADVQGEAGVTYTVIGMVKSLRTHTDKKGNEMAFGTLQDERGEIDLVFFSRTWENCKALVALDEILAIKGTIDPGRGKSGLKVSFMVSSIQDVNKLVRAAAKKAEESPAMYEEAITSVNGAMLVAENTPQYMAAEKNEGNLITIKTPETVMSSGRTTAEMEDMCREIHIRLTAMAMGNDAALYSLKNCLENNPSSCPVYLHIPVPYGSLDETVICTKRHGNTAFNAQRGAFSGTLTHALSECDAVADVWRA